MQPADRRSHLLVVLATVAAALLTCTATSASARPTPPDQLAPLGPDFLWGIASSGYQSEGHAPDSNWSRYIAAGKTPDPLLDSVDFLNRFRSDIALAAQLGIKVYGTGIEWARLQPAPGVWDENGFRFYDEVIGAIRAAGMRPMISLDHWVYPGWEADRGGWASPTFVPDWLANAQRVVDRYAGADPLWTTFNEPALNAYLEVSHGGLSPTDVPMMLDGIVRAHRSIYDYIHRVHPTAMVTSNIAYLSAVVDVVNDWPVVDRIADKLDFIGIDYYYGLAPDTLTTSTDFAEPWKNSLQPEGIYYALQHYSRAFPDKPLYIMENGMPTDNGLPRFDGYTRSDNLRDSIYWIQRAKADGMNVMGYDYWSITDNYEWGTYSARFGLYTVDILNDPSLTRRPTDAVATYTDIVHAGGVPSNYRPTRPPTPCSLVDIPTSCTDPLTVPN
ncbi:family 1 glycosylhydrolase [Nocardia bovistercoris]|uniref:Family 1 glycosylhydrolase n=1 Tax=Nocardia bovistercoris TaxID=2785916 RepID=A0A931N6K1_9NOCA|nr:family 1 glycosylhydrolase [Nocardia bovistercoris]MBH0781054.1 family 1 glycosylhydrolase [Nocardia bovistercoris]